MRLGKILLAGVAALVPLAHVQSQGVAAAATRSTFVAPSGDVVLARTVIRQLGDGKLITVTRRYKVQFVPVDGGYRLDGELIDVAVDVPPALNKLADIERNRPDTGLFPMMLDSQGFIRNSDPQVVDRESRARIFSEASSFLGSSGLNAPDRQDSIKVVGQLTSNAPNSPWPADLFNPQPGERRQERDVAMPDGRTGQVIVVIRVGSLLPCGLPHQLEREVTTVLAGSQRVSREVFTITLPGSYQADRPD